MASIMGGAALLWQIKKVMVHARLQVYENQGWNPRFYLAMVGPQKVLLDVSQWLA